MFARFSTLVTAAALAVVVCASAVPAGEFPLFFLPIVCSVSILMPASDIIGRQAAPPDATRTTIPDRRDALPDTTRVVEWFFATEEGAAPTAADVFTHITALQEAGINNLNEGTRVSFSLV